MDRLNNATIQLPYGHEDLKKRCTYTAANKIEYEGTALPGTAEAEAGWQIKKRTYDATDNETQVDFASGSNLYDKVWDDRATYSYS